MNRSLKRNSGRSFAIRNLFFIACLALFVSPRLSAQDFKLVPFGFWPAANDRMELIVDETDPSAAGISMIPFRLRYASGTPQTQDQSFQLLTISAGMPFVRQSYLPRVHSQIVTIPAGKVSADGLALIPQNATGNMLRFELTSVDAKYSEKIPADRVRSYYARSATPDDIDIQKRPTLILHSALPNFAERLKEFEPYFYQSNNFGPPVSKLPDYWEKLPILPSPKDLVQANSSPANLAYNSFFEWSQLKKLNTKDATENWLGYSCFEQMLITVDDARDMKANEPARWQAIRDWLATGGKLFLLNGGEEFQKLDQVEELFGFDAGQNEKFDDWLAITAFGHPNEFVDAEDQAANQVAAAIRLNAFGFTDAIYGRFRRIDNREQILKWNADLLLHEYGLGVIVLFSRENNQLSNDGRYSSTFVAPVTEDYSLPENFKDFGAWTRLSTFFYSSYPNLNERASFNVEQFASGKVLLEIPGVGEPPVNTFRILITLFFAIVGPLNYFLLRAQRRLHLILFTLPMFAFLACAGLILYSLFADGFKTRGRIISYSEIDQRSKQLVSYSNQAYYSPLSADDKLSFSTDTAVFPVAFDRINRPFLTEMDNGTQTLSGGNLQARVNNQYFVMRSSATEAGLEFAETDSLQFRNLLGGRIASVIIRDAEGNFFQAQQVGVGESATATPCSLSAARIDWEKQLKILDDGIGHISRNMQGMKYVPNLTIALMKQDVSELEHGSYLAIVESSTEIPTLQPKAKFESSLNIIRGSW